MIFKIGKKLIGLLKRTKSVPDSGKKKASETEDKKPVRNRKKNSAAPAAAPAAPRQAGSTDKPAVAKRRGNSRGKSGSSEYRPSTARNAEPYDRDLDEDIPPPPRRAAVKPVELAFVPPEEGKVRFIDLSVHEDILYGIQEEQFRYCTPIQAKCLPAALGGHDVIGKAQTGTGKTAAFLITIFNRFLNNPLPPEKLKAGSCRALILAPTRELAIQIHKDAEKLGVFCGLHNVVVYGGMGHKSQRAMLNRPVDVLVGTPGRILDYMSTGDLRLENVEILVIDEADRMLDMGFIPDVSRIVGRLPNVGVRQTMFFSATINDNINGLVKRWLKDPVMVETEADHAVTDLIAQRFYVVSVDEKFPLLLWLITHDEVERMIIFVNRKDVNAALASRLGKYGVDCESLSGDVPQMKRLKILERFRSGDTKILIATDVAARGIHVDDVSHVVNYEIPERAEDYVHRVGRTGRAGKTGKSITFVCEYGAYLMPELEKTLDHEIKCIHPEENMIHLEPPPGLINDREFRPGRSYGGSGGRFGGRSSGPRSSGPRSGGRSGGGDRRGRR